MNFIMDMKEKLVLVEGSREQTKSEVTIIKFSDKYLFVHVKEHIKKSELLKNKEKIDNLNARQCLNINSLQISTI